MIETSISLDERWKDLQDAMAEWVKNTPPYTLNLPQPMVLSHGWECPRCHQVNAPHMWHCDCAPVGTVKRCIPMPPYEISTGSSTISADDFKGWVIY